MQKYIKGIQYECVLNTDTWAKVENSCFLKIKLAVTAKGHQIAHGPKPDPEARWPTGLMGGPARYY